MAKLVARSFAAEKTALAKTPEGFLFVEAQQEEIASQKMENAEKTAKTVGDGSGLDEGCIQHGSQDKDKEPATPPVVPGSKVETVEGKVTASSEAVATTSTLAELSGESFAKSSASGLVDRENSVKKEPEQESVDQTSASEISTCTSEPVALKSGSEAEVTSVVPVVGADDGQAVSQVPAATLPGVTLVDSLVDSTTSNSNSNSASAAS